MESIETMEVARPSSMHSQLIGSEALRADPLSDYPFHASWIMRPILVASPVVHSIVGPVLRCLSRSDAFQVEPNGLT